MQLMHAFGQQKGRKLVVSFSNVDPQSSSSNLLAWRCNHVSHNEMQYLNENENDEKNLSYLGLLLKWLGR
jgi:hypothetical protein